MKILGALLAGGKSKRFGSDKAFARYKNQYLIDHAIELLQPQCDAILICGRTYKNYASVQDDPMEQGPLGGINAALKYAIKQDFDAIISFPCDTISRNDVAIAEDNIVEPVKIRSWFVDAYPAYLADQPVIGYWPCTLSRILNSWLQTQKRRSMIAWAEYSGAKAIESADLAGDTQLININKTEDLKL